MRKLIMLPFLLFMAFSLFSQESVDQLRKQMAKIRQSTNWEDPEQAKKANEEIQKLSKKIMNMPKGNPSGSQGDAAKMQEIKEENTDQKLKLWNEVFIAASKGKNADIWLGKPLREKINEEYKEEDAPPKKTPEFYQEMTFLMIDFTDKGVQTLIDEMEAFKSIKTMVITGGSSNLFPLNLEELLTKAKEYPLQELYIINCKKSVVSIPPQIGNFKKLQTLSLVNNQITALPEKLNSLSELSTLLIDMNPVSNIYPLIKNMNALKTLGIGKTEINAAEQTLIKKEIPDCQILLQ